MEPPAEMELYSNRPSKTGQSSPVLTAVAFKHKSISMRASLPAAAISQGRLTLGLFPSVVVHIVRRDATEEFDIFVCVKLSHFLSSCGLCSL